jgi:two-component system chemotaxis sensor kinase CheA
MPSGTSGRGVGMDVVKTNVETLKGDISVESKPGEYTRFVLTLPVNYSILRALIVESGDEVSVIPLDFVVETLSVDRERIIRHGARSRMPYKDGLIPLVELAAVLDYRTGSPADGEALNVVILRCRDEFLGVVVDRILRREEVVVKSVGEFLKGMRLVSGATILRMGDPAIILNIFDLFDVARNRQYEIRPAEKSREPPRVLVVDDSITVRTVQKGILESAGYSVDLAPDGEKALEMVHARKYDLVVTDVEMPKKNGFELTLTLKKDPRTRSIPVVIVTTHAEEHEKRRGIEVGARAYIVKGTFDQQVLLETVERLIG